MKIRQQRKEIWVERMFEWFVWLVVRSPLSSKPGAKPKHWKIVFPGTRAAGASVDKDTTVIEQ